MKVKIFYNKSIEENASIYFDKAKKFKKKIEGAEEALEKSKAKLKALEKKAAKEEKVEEKVERKKEWYEKFRWFYSSEGLLCIGGRDATTNEIIIKKHTDKEDIVFHTEMSGSPFFVIKSEGKKVGEKTIEETAQAVASYSKAWKVGLSNTDVFYVNPDQVSKEAEAGEYVAKGSFMIRGKKNIIRANLQIAIGIKDGNVIGGPVEAIRKNADKFKIIVQGKGKSSDTAKKINKKIGGDLDEIIRFLPAGGTTLK